MQTWEKRSRTRRERDREAEALTLLGPRSAQLVEVLPDGLVLERASPGTPVPSGDDEVATALLAEALLTLWVPVPEGCHLPSVEEECRALDDPAVEARLPPWALRAAREALEELGADPPEDRVLHGDLHHGNLLWSHERGWVAIDPHGLVGDPGYDVGPILLNPWGSDLAGAAPRRLEILEEVLGTPAERLRRWGLVRAVLSEAWSVQDTGDVDGGPLALASALVGEGRG